jgi:MFS family permease
MAATNGSYKWTVLINTTIGTLMATIDSSIVLISLPAIFRGIRMNPLTTSNTSYLLWMLMNYVVVTAVLVVSFGRIGDMFGLSPARQATITGHAFFPGLISGPFHHGLSVVFTFALVMCLVAAAASWLRGAGDRAENGEAAPRELAANEVPLTEPAAAGALTWDPAMILREDA